MPEIAPALRLLSGAGRYVPVLAICAALVLTGCAAREGEPAPVTLSGLQQNPGAGVANVGPGDTLYDIAQRYRLPMIDIIALNDLQPPFELAVGERLRLPAPRDYTVRNGDSLYTVSRSFGVDASQLANLNQLRSPYELRAGMSLRLPGSNNPHVIDDAADNRVVARADSLPPPLPEPKPGRARPVPAVPVSAAVVTAPTPPPVAAQPAVGGPLLPRAKPAFAAPAMAAATAGDGLVIAGGGVMAAPSAGLAPLPGDKPTRSQPRTASKPVIASRQAAPPAVPAPDIPTPVPAPDQSPAPARPQIAGAGMVMAQPPSRSGGFAWPLAGRLVSKYGPKAGGLHNDGINIAAPKGTPVRVAENGVVAYAGNELRGFGNLLLVRHADGWMTAYAHLDRLLVGRGETVRQGETIATVGKTGAVDAPQLHFEIRRGSQAFDPLVYLPRSAAGQGS